MNREDAVTSLGGVAVWRKSSYSTGDNNCVEVSTSIQGWVGVRDSKLGAEGPILAFTLSEWAAFTSGVLNGEFES